MADVADAATRARQWAELVDHLIHAPGHLAAEVRQTIFDAENVPAELAGLVDTVTRHAYRVTDTQVDAARRAGYSEDQLFEAIVVAAASAGERRLRVARRAMVGRDG